MRMKWCLEVNAPLCVGGFSDMEERVDIAARAVVAEKIMYLEVDQSMCPGFKGHGGEREVAGAVC